MNPMNVESIIKGTNFEDTVPKEIQTETDETSSAIKGILGRQLTDMKFEPASRTIAPAKLSTLDELHDKDLRDASVFVTWPFIELSNNYNLIRQSIKELEDTKKAMQSIDAQHMDPNSTKLAKMDILRQAGIKDSVAKDFDNRYVELRQDADRLEALLSSFISYYTPYANSVTFLSNSMVETCKQRQSEMAANEKATNKDFLIKRMGFILAAYADRSSFEPLINKLSYGNVLVDYAKEFQDKDPREILHYIDEVFFSTYHDRHMAAFRARLVRLLLISYQPENPDMEITDEMKVDALFVTFWLAKVYEQEFNSGKCAYVKTFIMNTYDSAKESGMKFDIEGGQTLMAVTVRFFYQCLTYILRAYTTGKVSKKKLRDSYKDICFNPRKQDYETMSAEARKLNPKAEMPVDTHFNVLFPDIEAKTLCDDLDHIRREKRNPSEDIPDPVEEETPKAETTVVTAETEAEPAHEEVANTLFPDDEVDGDESTPAIQEEEPAAEPEAEADPETFNPDTDPTPPLGLIPDPDEPLLDETPDDNGEEDGSAEEEAPEAEDDEDRPRNCIS